MGRAEASAPPNQHTPQPHSPPPALLRLRHPSHTLRSPAQFAPTVDTRLEPALAARLSGGRPPGKNFMSENLRKARAAGGGAGARAGEGAGRQARS